jgi:hypothetical protein
MRAPPQAFCYRFWEVTNSNNSILRILKIELFELVTSPDQHPRPGPGRVRDPGAAGADFGPGDGFRSVYMPRACICARPRPGAAPGPAPPGRPEGPP